MAGLGDGSNHEVSSITNVREQLREEHKTFRMGKKNDIFNKNREVASSFVTDFSIQKMDELHYDLIHLALKDSTSDKRLYLLSQVRIGASFGEEYISRYIRHKGSLSQIIKSLKWLRNSQCQLEAAICLTNLAAGNHSTTEKVALLGTSSLIEFMQCKNPKLQAQCSWAVKNICEDCEKCFLILKKNGTLTALLNQLKSFDTEVLQSAILALNALTKYDHHFDVQYCTEITTSLLNILENPNVQLTISNVIFTLSNICQLVMEYGLENLHHQIFELALKNLIISVEAEFDFKLATACIRCLGIITASNELYCKTLAMNEKFEVCILKIFACQYPHLKKETLWVLNNIISCIDTSNSSFDLSFLVQHLKTFICPVDNKALYAMNILCLLMTKETNFKIFLKENCLDQVKILQNCGSKDLEMISTTFLKLASCN